MLEILPEEEYILVDSIETMLKNLDLHSGDGYHFGQTDEVDKIFNIVSSLPGKVTVVTSYNDAGIHEQALAHPNDDLTKLVNAVDWAGISAKRDLYQGVTVGPAVTDRCRPQDKYVVKTDRWSWATFNEIPENVKCWYSTNLNIEHQKAKLIPFGLNNDGPGHTFVSKYAHLPKKGLLYVNFQDNTMERVYLKKFYNDKKWATTRLAVGLPVEKFLEELSSHAFALVPEGCGLDSYRLYECLYMNVLPIMKDSIFTRKLQETGLPIVLTNDLFSLTEELLYDTYSDMMKVQFNYDFIKLSHWKEKFGCL